MGVPNTMYWYYYMWVYPHTYIIYKDTLHIAYDIAGNRDR